MDYEKILREEGNRKGFVYKDSLGLILRVNPEKSGHLCGYVRVGKKLGTLDFDEYDDLGIEVHGGITYSGMISGEEGYWLGFDCAHAGDLSPAYDSDYIETFSEHGYTYKDMDYVESEIKHMIDQLLELENRWLILD